MIIIEVDKISYDDLQNDLKKYGTGAKRAINTAVKAAVVFIQKMAKQRLHGLLGSARHYITGRLATSIHPEYKSGETFSYTAPESKLTFDGSLNQDLEELEAVVGTNVEYAAKIEFEKDQYLGYAAQQGSAYFEERIIKELNKIVS